MLRFHALLPVLFAFAWLAVVPAFAAGKDAADDRAALEAQLQAARARLDEAGREVAELSARLGVNEPLARSRRRVRTPDHGVLGIRIDQDAESRGVTVAAVTPGGPAAEAGIVPGDVIVALDGRPMKSRRDVVHAMRDLEPGSRVALDLHRGGRPLSVYVVAHASSPDLWHFDEQLQALPELEGLSGMLSLPRVAACLRDGLGADEEADGEARFATLTPALGRYFGAEQGVLVVRAPAEDGFRLQDGDVLRAIDGRVPQSAAHAWRILRSYQPGEKLVFEVLRQRKAQRLEVTIPADPGAGGRRVRTPAPGPGAPPPPLRP